MQNVFSRGRILIPGSSRLYAKDHAVTMANIASHRQLPVSVHQKKKTLHGFSRRLFSANADAAGSSSTTGKSFRFSFRSGFDWYSKKLDTHPITTKCISAALISSLGNALAQKITHEQDRQQRRDEWERKHADKPTQHEEQEPREEPFELNLAQIGRFALLNATFVAPVLHQWYQFINRAVPGRSMSRVLQRTFWDEFVFSPVYIPAFLAMLWKLEGVANDRILEMIKSECPSIIVAEWALWVPTMIVTFRYAPVKFQVLVINVVGVVWQTFLAYSANNAHSSSGAEDDSVDQEQKGKATDTGIVIPEDKKPLVLESIVQNKQ